MKIDCEWGGKLKFVAQSDKFKIEMDAVPPFGNEEAPSPKQYLLSALCGCTGMDVLSLLKKNRQVVDKFTIVAEASTKASHPQIFTDISLKFYLEGACESAAVMEAVHLSQTRYCSIAAMLTPTTRITYDVILNGDTLNKGNTEFQENTLI